MGSPSVCSARMDLERDDEQAQRRPLPPKRSSNELGLSRSRRGTRIHRHGKPGKCPIGAELDNRRAAGAAADPRALEARTQRGIAGVDACGRDTGGATQGAAPPNRLRLVGGRPFVDVRGAPTARPVPGAGPARPEDHRKKSTDDPDNQQVVTHRCLYAQERDSKFERAAVKWLGRFIEECSPLLLRAQIALAALSGLRGGGEAANRILSRLLRHAPVWAATKSPGVSQGVSEPVCPRTIDSADHATPAPKAASIAALSTRIRTRRP